MGRITIERDEITPRLDAFPDKLQTAVDGVFKYAATDIQNHMRTKAPWTDRTGNARQGLFAKSFTEPKKWVIVMYHSVPYGIWLEVRWGGRYAIIKPTLQVKGREVMALLNKVMRKMS